MSARNTQPTPTAPVVATPAATPATPANCGCGCNRPTVTAKARFLSGHDARHAANLAAAILAGKDVKAALQAPAMSDRLRDKVDGIVATQRKREAERKAAKAAKAVAKAAYEKALADALKG